jgi:RecB family exonuclease
MEVVAVPYGEEAIQQLRAVVAAAKRDEPLAPVTVLVPTNYAGVSTRRWLARSGNSPMPRAMGLAGVGFLTVVRLAELIGSPRLVAAGRRPVSNAVVASAVRQVLADSPGLFAPVAQHPTTETQLVRVHRELRDLPTGALDALAATSPRAADVVRLHRATTDLLATDFYDEHDLLVAARRADAGQLGPLGHVVLYLPQDLSRAAGGLVGHVAASVPTTVIAGVTGLDDADGTVRRSIRRMGAELPAAAPLPARPIDRVVDMSDADDEVRWVVRAVVGALGEGVPLERMAVLYTAHEPYARLVDEHFEAAGLARNGTSVRRLSETVVGRAVLGLLDLPDHGFRREELTAWLTSGPIRDGSGGLVPSTAWERLSRQAGVVDRGDWDHRLATLAADLRRQADEAECGGEEPWRVDRLRRDADRAEALRELAATVRADLVRCAEQRTWAGVAAWLGEAMRRYLGSEHQRRHWPAIELAAADRIDAAVERLAGLDAVEPGPDLATFRRALAAELDATLGRVGRFGEGILTGRPGVALGVELDRVFVLGMVEGHMPPRVTDDSLLPDRERAVVGDLLDARSSVPADEHRYLLAALASATGERVATWPRGDLRRNAERTPSRWVDPGGDTVRSHVDGLSRSPFPPTEQEYTLQALLLGTPVDELAERSPELRRGTELVRARRSRAFTRFDGNLSSLDGRRDPTEQVFSATRLEAYANCPHAYLLEYELRVELVENPEDIFEISALDRGSIIHSVLDAYVRDAAGPDRLPELFAAVCDPYRTAGRIGRAVFWDHARAEMTRDLHAFAARDAAHRSDGDRPVATELAFGLTRGELEPVPISLPDGRIIRFRGSVDRLDDRPDGSLLVLDYKTGGLADYAAIERDDPVQRGRRLQLPIYAHAARHWAADPERPVEARYWFITQKGRFRRVGYQLDAAVDDRFRDVLTVLIDGLAAGHYPARPPEVRYTARGQPTFFDADGLGSRDREREWELKRGATELAAFVGLVEPDG